MERTEDDKMGRRDEGVPTCANAVVVVGMLVGCDVVAPVPESAEGPKGEEPIDACCCCCDFVAGSPNCGVATDITVGMKLDDGVPLPFELD